MGERMAKYVEILFRHRLRFLILLVVLPAELALACVFLFPHQTGTASLWVDTPAYITVSQGASGWNSYLTPAQNTVDSLDQLRSTDSFFRKLRGSLDASKTFESISERDSVLSTVTTDTLITATGSHLVVLTYTCPHQPICTNVLTATVQIYHQWLLDRETAQADVAITFYTGQVADAQKKLESDENALTDYVNAHPSVKATDATLNPEFGQLISTVDGDKSSAAALQQKLDDTKLSKAAIQQLDGTVFKVVDPARTVGGRLNNLPKKQMTIAGIAALALAAAVLLIMVWSDRSTREPKDIEGRVRIPVVVTIPDLALMRAGDG
jgi:capsular polysaccharide biosynthesis protein